MNNIKTVSRTHSTIKLHHHPYKSTLCNTIFPPVPESQDKKWLLLTTQVTQSIVTQWLSDNTEKSHLRSNSVTTRITPPPTTKYHTTTQPTYYNPTADMKIVNTYNHFSPTTPPSTFHHHLRMHYYSGDQFLLPPIWWPLSTSTSWVNTSHSDHSSNNLLLPPLWWRLLPSPLQWLPPTLTSPLTTFQSHHSGDLLQLYPIW